MYPRDVRSLVHASQTLTFPDLSASRNYQSLGNCDLGGVIGGNFGCGVSRVHGYSKTGDFWG